MCMSFKTCKVLRRMGHHPLVSTVVPAQLPYPPLPTEVDLSPTSSQFYTFQGNHSITW